MHDWAYMQSSAIRILGVFTLFQTALLILSPPARAATSGLNNIPTADTVPHLTLVLQEYSTFGARRPPDHTAGFKFGIDPWETSAWRNRFEVGMDGHFAPSDAGPAVFHAKFTTQPHASGPALGLGVVNLAATRDDRDRTGQPLSYAVLSPDLTWFRLHAGYGVQAENNHTALLGIDKTIKLFNRDLMLRADAVQIERQHNWAASLGGVYSFGKYFAFESWVTQPIHRHPPSFTMKFNVIFRF